ncbi:MAG: phosphodiester glycosidase family protein [Candidatus Eremiobacteraeota bacterium]|nr:phosphodiester glycosidase family protein [Candidatus Eremiobacteraeota bacterium]
MAFARRLVSLLFFALAIARLGANALAATLPQRLDPPAPFPAILQQAPTIENVAPGIDYGDYRLRTVAGLLSVHIIAVQTRRSDVKLGTILADDSLISKGETIGSMARRARAVGGLNGDFFDIGNTNRPIGIVVRDGALLQLPYKRYALAITRDGAPHFAEFSISGEIQIDERTMPLEGIDEMPPNGGLSLLTPLYGRVPPEENVTLVTVQPLGGVPPLGRYRVTGVADNTTPQPPGYYVAIGPSDYSYVNVPAIDAVVTVTGDLQPFGLDSLAAAIGGGALILHDGTWYDDRDAPYRAENEKRMPCSGAAIGNGMLYLIEVDGRQPDVSVGVTRREFSALMRSLGADEGLLFDGGGSSTIVARRLGEDEAGVLNSPSDGRERPVADGIFVYSLAKTGAPVRLVARPFTVRALSGAQVPLRIAAVDAANHVVAGAGPIASSVVPASLGSMRNGAFFAARPGWGHVFLRDRRLRGEVGLEIAAAPERIEVFPTRPNVDPNGTIALSVRAFDADGYPLALPPTLHWTATAGSIDGRGEYRATGHDARVDVRIGDSVANTRVTVGSHDVALAFASRARFVTHPPGGTGSVVKGYGCGSCVALTFSFSGSERGAYAVSDLALPPDTLGLTFDVRDDGSAARLRVDVRNQINEDVLLDAAQLGEPGWRTVTVRFPPETDAVRLFSLYVLPLKGIELSEGTVILRNVRAIVAGQ